MPKRLIRQFELECDYCTQSEKFDLQGDPSKILPKLGKWIGVIRADAPAGEGVPDQTKWYDGPQCAINGIKRDDEARYLESQAAKAAEPNRNLSPAADATGAVELPR